MFIEATRGRRYQVVEDVSAFGKRCYFKVPKRRIACTCGYKGTRWLLLKRPERLTEAEEATLQKLFAVNERLYKVYVLRDEFRQIFQGETVRSRLLRLDNWIKRAKAVCIPQLTEYVHKIEEWKPYIQNSLRANCSNGFAEGINAKIRVIQRMAYGYKDFEYFRLKVIQQFGSFRNVGKIEHYHQYCL